MATENALPVLDLDAALERFGGQWGILLRAARTFVSTYAELPQQCASLAGANAFIDLSNIAHRIKGAAALIGAERLALVAGALEDGARHSDRQHLPQLAADFIAELAAALQAMASLTPAGSGTACAPLPAQVGAADELLQQLVPLLRDADYGAASVLDQLALLLGASQLAPQLAAIRSHFDKLDTEEAAICAEQLRRHLASLA
jgi:two-component system sensor histidine kinase/response regulator